MRFIENGPSIPDALLQARDEGRVVFFCGAGVSRARARLPDFFGLAESAIRELGAPAESDACKVLQKAREIGEELDVTGLISADRVFSLLEREFTTQDIESAVAKCLAPAADVDRSAHEMLLRLARTPSGKTQLVTTNFDRLFEGEAGTIPFFQPPRLPHLSRYDDLDGIVYLHGRVNAEYAGADGDGFVLSSSDFGHAYLSEGWATEFFREIVRDYVVVFIGYSADDPPVHYLLEGLRRSASSLNGIYALQSDGSAELSVRWQHKGVAAITYAAANHHRALWETLEHWALRADDPRHWQQVVLNRAIDGPRQLHPHERGQVAHIVSTYEGARAFAESRPPAEWLCVFDPRCRYEWPGRLDWIDPDSQTIEPFSLYGLDSDEVPQRSGDGSVTGRREVPSDAWDAFVLNNLDQQDLSPNNLPAVRGSLASNVPALPRRLICFGVWIANVANEPAAVWWAARQEALHPGYRRNIEWGLSRLRDGIDDELRRVWKYILEAWNSPRDSRRDWYDLKQELDREGWSLVGVRRFVGLSTPYLKVGPGLMSWPAPPAPGDEFRVFDLARIDVECPVPPAEADIPDQWLRHVVRGLRANIETAVRLCEEVNDYHRLHISPIAADDRPDISKHQRTHGFSGCVISLASLYERLVEVDRQRALEELATWPSDDDTAFARLRFWASGKPELATPDAFFQVIHGLSEDVFWDSDHQRDLLLVLAKRWADLPIEHRHGIEARLLRGPSRYEGEDDDSYKERLAWAVVTRLQWLKTHGCEFSFDVDDEIAARGRDAPNWKPEYAARAAESREIRGGFVATDTDYGALVREPIRLVLSKALELSGRSDADSLKEHDPFAGLCAERPKRAYLALAHAARRDAFPIWAWNTFLNSQARENDASTFSATIAARICRLPDEILSQLLHSATWWLRKVSKEMSKDFPGPFDRVVQRLFDVVKANPTSASSAIIRSTRARDWVTEAINSPVGHLVQAIFDDERVDEPDAFEACLTTIAQFLSLSGDPRRHAIAMVSHHLGWLHAKAAEWTEQHLLTILDADDADDRAALWAGFFWNPRISSSALYLRIKDGLIEVARRGNSSREGHVQSLAYLILMGWVSSHDNDGRRWVASAEFKDALLHGGDDFRSHVLWQIDRSLREEDPEEREAWHSRAREFFDEVWPRQRSVKTSAMTTRLCELIVSHRDSFLALIDIVSPLLTTINDATTLHIHFPSELDELVKSHPEKFLHLLHKVLPDDVRYWPYGIGDALEMIAEADESMLNDARFLELRRKWSAR